jgi:hypothetical protein
MSEKRWRTSQRCRLIALRRVACGSLAQGPPKGYPNGGPRLGSRKAIWGFDQGTDSEMIANEGGDAAARMGQDSPKARRSNP